jgi:hypothetical protein
MLKKAFHGVLPTLLVLAVVSISLSVLGVQGLLNLETEVSGSILSPVWATELSTLEKEVGQFVHFKATIKNTGNVETTYCIVAKWSEHGVEEGETAGLADAHLSPGQSEMLTIGSVECTEAMMGKYFDVKFVLYQWDTERVLEEKVIAEAFYVQEVVVSGDVTGYWVE